MFFFLIVGSNLHITVTCIKRWGLRASSLSAVAKADAGLKPSNNHLKPQCFIHDVTAWCSLFYIIFLSICYFVSVCRTWGQTHSLTSFGFCVGSCGLAMCVAVKGWHIKSDYIFRLGEIVSQDPLV